MKVKYLFVEILLLMLFASCRRSTSSLTPASVPATVMKEQCQLAFQEVITLTEASTRNEDPVIIVDKVIYAGEYFLNNCITPDLPLSTQSKQLTELSQFAQVIPPSFSCAVRYTPTYQLVDLNNDKTDELILHLQAIRCDINALLGFFGGGGLSIVFHQDKQTQNWKGNLIWPCSKDNCPWTGAWDQSPQPLVQTLDIRDSQNQSFMLVAGGYIGGDHTGIYLTIWRWRNSDPEIVSEIHLTDWCGTPNEWEITKEGFILIPSTEATSRCQAREAVLYVLKGDEFVAEMP